MPRQAGRACATGLVVALLAGGGCSTGDGGAQDRGLGPTARRG